MPKRAVRRILLSALVCALLCACGGTGRVQNAASEQSPFPALRVCVSLSAKQIPPVSLLADAAFRSEIEERIGARIELVSMMDTEALSLSDAEIFPSAFSGVAFITDPLSIVSLSERELLYEFTDADMQRPLCMEFDALQHAGRFLGRQYGLVFPSAQKRGEQLRLVVASDILRESGISHIPFTPEAFREALETIHATGVTPLAAYASPAGTGFGILLALNGLVGSGEHEFVYTDGRAAYTKLGKEAQAYLAYVRSLYEEGLIPSDFLSLTQYAAVSLLAEGRCAMAVFSDTYLAEYAVAWAAESGRSLAVAELPKGATMGRANDYKYLIGVVTNDYPQIDTALALFDALASCSETWTVSESPAQVQTYPLFDGRARNAPSPRGVDPVYACPYNMRLLYEKQRLDSVIIEPYYGKLVAGELPLGAFDDMVSKWNDAGGATITEMYTYYYGHLLSEQAAP